MQHITYRPVDRQFGCLERDLPPGAPFNRVPPLPDIAFGFALETRYPEEVYFGTVDGEVTDDPAIEMRAVTKAEYDAAEAAELAARAGEAPTASDVDAEHDRRAIAGCGFPIDGIGDVPLEGTERTQLVLLALKDTARDLRDAGVTSPLLMFTDRDGADRYLTAEQMIALVNAGKAWMQKLHQAKRDLKVMDPIPTDFADDRHWPPAP